MRSFILALSFLCYTVAFCIAVATYFFVPVANYPHADQKTEKMGRSPKTALELKNGIEQVVQEQAVNLFQKNDLHESVTAKQLKRELDADTSPVNGQQKTISGLRQNLSENSGKALFSEIKNEQPVNIKLPHELNVGNPTLEKAVSEQIKVQTGDFPLTKMGETVRKIEIRVDNGEKKEWRQTLNIEMRPKSTINNYRKSGHIISIIGGGLFSTGQYKLTPEIKEMVMAIIPLLSANPDYLISLTGHSDSKAISSTPAKKFVNNTALSLLRAKAVENFLKEQGMAAKRITTIGVGTIHPLTSNFTEGGRAANRRVEIRIIEPGNALKLKAATGL